MMKRIGTLIITLALCLAVSNPAGAVSNTFERVWSLTDTCDATGPAATYLGFGGTIGIDGQIPKAEISNVTSDLSTSKLFALTPNGDNTTTDAANASGQKTLFLTATTGLQASAAGAGSWISIVDKTKGAWVWEINRVSSLAAGVSASMIRNLENTYPSGAVVRELTNTLGGPLIGNTTKDWEVWTFYGKVDDDLAFYVDGTSSCSINYIAGGYIKQ